MVFELDDCDCYLISLAVLLWCSRLLTHVFCSRLCHRSAPELFAHLQKLHEQKKLKLYRTKTTPPDPNATAASVNVMYVLASMCSLINDRTLHHP